MSRFRIDLHHESLMTIRQRLVDLRHVILGNQWILETEEEIDRAADLAGPGERAGISHRDAAAVKADGRLNVFIMVGCREIGKAPTHAETGHTNGPGLDVTLRLEMGDDCAHIA